MQPTLIETKQQNAYYKGKLSEQTIDLAKLHRKLRSKSRQLKCARVIIWCMALLIAGLLTKLNF